MPASETPHHGEQHDKGESTATVRHKRPGAAAREQMELERIEALRLASSELAKRAARFHSALLHSSQKRGFTKTADTRLAETLTKSISVEKIATELVQHADRKRKPPAPWARECAAIRGDLQHRSAPVLSTVAQTGPKLTHAEAAVLEQAAAARLKSSTSAAVLLNKYTAKASTHLHEWTHWSFMQHRRLEQLHSGPGLAGGGGSATGLLAWGANL
jgi:hypothetical protein